MPAAQEQSAHFVFFLLFIFSALALWLTIKVMIFVWVYRDARARGDNPFLWMLLVLFFHLLGFLIYLGCRRGGVLIRCETCGGLKLEYLAVCPHCGHAGDVELVGGGREYWYLASPR